MKTVCKAILAALMLAAAPLAWAEDPVGKWTGVLATADGTLPVGATIVRGADGALTATIQSPSQTEDSIPVDTVVSDGKTLTITSSAIAGVYEGVWNDKLKSWTGDWKQGGQVLPLVLVRSQQ